MWQRLGLGIRKLRGKATLQLKFSLSYILVIAAVLILLNSYPLLVSQNMMVASNQNNLKTRHRDCTLVLHARAMM